jgi:hypothetical protein
MHHEEARRILPVAKISGNFTDRNFGEPLFSAVRLFYGNVAFLPQDFEFVGAASQKHPEAQHRA